MKHFKIPAVTVDPSAVIMFQVHQVQEAPRVTRVPRDLLARQDKRVIKEIKGCQGWWDLKERKVLLDHQVRQGQKVQLGLEVFQVLKGREDLEVDLETLVKKVTLELRGFLVVMDSQGCQVPKGHRVPEEQQDLQGWRDLVGLLDPSALLVLRGFQGYLRLYLRHFLSLLSPHRSLNRPNHLNLPNQHRNHKVLCPGRSNPLWPPLQHLVS